MTHEFSAQNQAVPLRMQGVTKRYGSRAVIHHLDLDINRGEIVTLLGPNGAGKTTTLSIALGFEIPDDGRIEISGIDMKVNPQRARARIGYIPENVQLYPLLSGLENLEYFAELARRRTTMSERADMLLRAGLPREAHDRPLRQYSKGMRQKTGIALALLRHSELLLLDEPTSGLDPKATDELFALLQQTARTGVGILMVTHEITQSVEIADRVHILQSGRIATSFTAKPIQPEVVRAEYFRASSEVA